MKNTVEYLKSIDIIQKTRNLLGKFTGLDLEVLDIPGAGSRYPCAPLPQLSSACCTPECNRIPRETIETVLASKEARFFFCPGGRTKVLVPLLLHGEPVAIFFAGERGSSQMDKEQVEALSALLFQIGNYVLENEACNLRHFKGNPTTYKQELLQKVVRYIWNNAHENEFSLRQVAKENGISYCYLSHLFKNELKVTFVEYRQKVRMYKATHLLQDARLTVDQVAQTCGFEDSSYFCKTFKKVYGCTPVMFRHRAQSGRSLGKTDTLIQKHAVALSAAL